ncbi:MAG: hypothetical protein ACYSTG_03480 [Planctomycetota bacterium]|jgi:hypothetical protein
MVKKLLTLVLVLSMCLTAVGQISLKVYEADGVTPFDCNNDIMVGTKLTLIVSSDSNDYWSGGLFIAGQDRELGTLAGRDWDPNAIVSSSNDVISGDWTGSHFEEAGDMARVMDWVDSSICGFDLHTSVVCPNDWPGNPEAGDWFIIDYYTEEVGDCNVGFYDYYDYDTSWSEPNYYITFSHVPTRDLNSDEAVNFGDFAIFSSQWYATDCNDPNWCDGADLERDGDVDCNDLGLFVEYWLWPTSGNVPNEPNEPNYPENPNVVYRIVDANGLSEITIDVNDSITLYVDMETNDVNVYSFDVEVVISDPNLGSIDNTECPNGTAQILATPRTPYFDYWGPGTIQEEGIRLRDFNILSGPMSDGHLASFVFTCREAGDVTLDLINDYPPFPQLEDILIHQIDPNS